MDGEMQEMLIRIGVGLLFFGSGAIWMAWAICVPRDAKGRRMATGLWPWFCIGCIMFVIAIIIPQLLR